MKMCNPVIYSEMLNIGKAPFNYCNILSNLSTNWPITVFIDLE